ncbi:MAG: trigger factor, partial [Lachnospiraceae bacterium]|nr:trigger factor [Lachnospiraceae bacterium]
LEEYKEDVKKNLAEKKEKDAKTARENEAVDAAVKASEMEIPDAMLETQQRQMVDEFAQRITMQGLSMEQYMQFTGANYQQLIDQVKPQAEERIKSRLVLEAIARVENIVASEEDFEEEMKTMADVYQMEIDKVKELMGEKEKKNIMLDLAVRKAAKFVAENAVEE